MVCFLSGITYLLLKCFKSSLNVEKGPYFGGRLDPKNLGIKE